MIAWGIVLLGMLAAMIAGGILLVVSFLAGCVFAIKFSISPPWPAGGKILVVLLMAPLPLAFVALLVIRFLAPS